MAKVDILFYVPGADRSIGITGNGKELSVPQEILKQKPDIQGLGLMALIRLNEIKIVAFNNLDQEKGLPQVDVATILHDGSITLSEEVVNLIAAKLELSSLLAKRS